MVVPGTHAPRARRIARRNPDKGLRPPDKRVRHYERRSHGRWLSVRRNNPEPFRRRGFEGLSNAFYDGPQGLGQFQKQKDFSNGLGPSIIQGVNFNGLSKKHYMLAQRNGGDIRGHGLVQHEPNSGRFSVLRESPSAHARSFNGLPKERIRLAQKKGGAKGGPRPAHMEPRSEHISAPGVASTAHLQTSKQNPTTTADPGTSSQFIPSSSVAEVATEQREAAACDPSDVHRRLETVDVNKKLELRHDQ
ncbi:hypothetical protein F0562_002287 [Nyssa sinensis]|uniref:Uncharacterized protein n=1 Tax=Nyssa sinensis TaxID=561372 RepID=A0A5J5C976_9ASTE|nr:hypothetical protein F0562_002287 [Nyssa sinensis]